MKTPETENESDFDCSAWSTREELEHLIKLAPTAIHRQLLQQQLTEMEEADGTIEKADVSVEGDDTTVNESDMSVEEHDIKVNRADVSMAGDDVAVNTAEVSVEGDETTVEKTGVPAEQSNFVEQRKQADKSRATTQRRSRFSPAKIILLSAAIILILVGSVVLIRLDGSGVELEGLATEVKSDSQIMDSAMEYLEAFKHGVEATSLKVKTMVFGDNSIDAPSLVAEPVVATTAESQGSLFNMYKAKSLALDSLLEFDNFIELNVISRPQKEAEIKMLLQSAQSQQQYGQYSKAIDSYRQVSAELESLMSMTQQLIAKQSAAELAKLSWESYRWKLHRDSQNLPLTSEESMLVDLETETETMAQEGIIQRAIIGYEDIERQYVELLNAVEGAAKARESLESIRRHWYQFRDRHNVNGISTTGTEQAYRRGIEHEAAGAFQDAMDSYEVAGNRYKQALVEGKMMVAKRSDNARTTEQDREQ